MNSLKYAVYEIQGTNKILLANNMLLSNALMFMSAYCTEKYMTRVCLQLEEMEVAVENIQG